MIFFYPLEDKIVQIIQKDVFFLCFAQLSTSTTSQSLISGIDTTKRLTSTLNNIIYYYVSRTTNERFKNSQCPPRFSRDSIQKVCLK
jgi:hypothetical protein